MPITAAAGRLARDPRRLHRRQGEVGAPGRARAAMGRLRQGEVRRRQGQGRRGAEARPLAREARCALTRAIGRVHERRASRSASMPSLARPGRAGAGDRAVPRRCSWSCRWRRSIYVAFTEKGGGALTLVNFLDFARTDLFVRSFWNSVYVSAMTVRVGLGARAAARLPDDALRVPRRHAGADAGLPAADHAALRRRRRHAAPVRPQRHA